MANTIQIKRGSSEPSLTQLESYELGYVNNGNLYIRETIKDNSGNVTSDKIVQLTGLAATGLLNKYGYLQLPVVASTNSNTGRILVASSSGVVYYKTPANILSEIGALSTANGGTIAKDLTVTGKITANGTIIVNNKSYGTTDPNTANIPGTLGQLYFVLVEE